MFLELFSDEEIRIYGVIKENANLEDFSQRFYSQYS